MSSSSRRGSSRRAPISSRRPRELSIDDFGRAGDFGSLAPYAEPAYYRQLYRERTKDVAYYVRLARLIGGPVLEYGAGNGRVALALARSGIDVTAVDMAKPMLDDFEAELAKEPQDVRRRVTLKHANMLELRLRQRFPLVIAPFNVLLHLYEPGELEVFLNRVKAHLRPRGRFVFDFSVPALQDLILDPQKRFRVPRFRHADTGKVVRYSERFEYDPLRQLLVTWMEFSPVDGSPSWVIPLTHRQYFPAELRALLAYNGFADQTWTADFSDQEAHGAADALVVNAGLSRRPQSG